jgi:hypothetical protein
MKVALDKHTKKNPQDALHEPELGIIKKILRLRKPPSALEYVKSNYL